MDRKEFDNLGVEEQIKYINKELVSGYTLTKVCGLIGVGRSTIRDRAKKLGYFYNTKFNQYVCGKNETKVTNVNDNSKTLVACDRDDSLNNMEVDKSIIFNKNIMKNLIGLSENYDKIMDFIKWFENDKGKTNVIEVTEGIKIDLPEETDKEFRKTIRVNDVVWELFSEFCDKHKEFKQKDLHSQALLEYIKKYS
ncbi:hypothetical protein [Clostridium kluyveri]|uniref:Uncharacterized protein n=2 Tax=Clostridium kluyveri TaxID=1534 RepID=A5F9M2_CLOK5|nr:hypothetical protein [Clostridium kluyveri]ABQ23644.1 conserved hypothetical protein [Clostridium kluyveri DSM 555]